MVEEFKSAEEETVKGVWLEIVRNQRSQKPRCVDKKEREEVGLG